MVAATRYKLTAVVAGTSLVANQAGAATSSLVVDRVEAASCMALNYHFSLVKA